MFAHIVVCVKKMEGNWIEFEGSWCGVYGGKSKTVRWHCVATKHRSIIWMKTWKLFEAKMKTSAKFLIVLCQCALCQWKERLILTLFGELVHSSLFLTQAKLSFVHFSAWCNLSSTKTVRNMHDNIISRRLLSHCIRNGWMHCNLICCNIQMKMWKYF